MLKTSVKNRLGNTEVIIFNLGSILKETKTEVFVVFPDGVVRIKKTKNLHDGISTFAHLHGSKP